jgi:hypothetical protein
VERPVRPEIRPRDIVEGLDLRIHRLSADLEDAVPAQRHGSFVAAIGFPDGGDDRGRDEIPAVILVVVDERPDEQLACRLPRSAWTLRLKRQYFDAQTCVPLWTGAAGNERHVSPWPGMDRGLPQRLACASHQTPPVRFGNGM